MERQKLFNYLIDRAKAQTDIAAHLSLFCELVIGTNAQKIVELGTRRGDSTVALLVGAAQTGGYVVSVDHGRGSPYSFEQSTWGALQETSRVIREDLGLGSFWRLIVKDDLELAAQYDDEIDILLIDTVHSYDQTKNELERWGDKVVDGGYILVHDVVSYPEQRKAIWEFLDRNLPSDYVEYRESNGLGIIMKHSANDKAVQSSRKWSERIEVLHDAIVGLRTQLRGAREIDASIREKLATREDELSILRSEGMRTRGKLAQEVVRARELEARVSQLEMEQNAIEQSLDWRFIQRFRRFLNRHFPRGSRRRSFLERLALRMMGGA